MLKSSGLLFTMEFYKVICTFLAAGMLSSVGVRGQNCANLTGEWYNQLGSEMILYPDTRGRLTGEYRTAVEKRRGSAGNTYTNITGFAPHPHTPGQQVSSVFGFTVLWKDGKSTTAWVAQCLVCGGVEQIVTTWILRSRVDNCVDKWKAVMTGRDYFTRHEQRSGPRAHRGTHTPQDHDRYVSGRNKRGLRNADANGDVPLNSAIYQADTKARTRGRFQGIWYSEFGSQISLRHGDGTTTITGSYQTTTERLEQNKSGSNHSEVLGVGNPRHRDATLSLLLSWNNGHSITAWVGQVHLCTETNRLAEVLEAAFLHRTRIDHCHAEWKATLQGHTTFTKDDPFQNGGEEIAVTEFGEEEGTC